MTSLRIVLNDTLIPETITDDDITTLLVQTTIDMSCEKHYYANYEKPNILQYSDVTKNNFVNAFLQAYNNHKTLKIRPDDIKLQLTMIISTFVNNNAEMMRSFL